MIRTMNLFWEVLKQSTTLNVIGIGVSDHGIEHWLRVHDNGQRLAEETGADLVVVNLFALFHDSMRENEWRDPDHGWRGWGLAVALSVPGLLTDEQTEKLRFACIEHDRGLTSDDPTIGTCWDADRLDLPRVGIIPDPKYLSTQAAMEELEHRLRQESA